MYHLSAGAALAFAGARAFEVPMSVVSGTFLPEAKPSSIAAFLRLAGERAWAKRIADLTERARCGQRGGRALIQRHALELTLDRQSRGAAITTRAERIVAGLAQEAVSTHTKLPADGRARLRERLRAALAGEATLAPLMHLFRTAALQRSRGFTVQHCGLADGAAHDLLIARDGAEAEIACDSLSAEEGRDVNRTAFVNLADLVDPDLQTWLAAHPGRYVLKLTLPQGLRADQSGLAQLHGRIRAMLEGQRRADHDEAAVLRLDPLMLAGAQLAEPPAEQGLMGSLRREFGAEANLAVTTAGGGVLVLAARAARADEVAVAIRRRLAVIAPLRLSGTRPGILSMFVDDTDRTEWRALRDRLELEGEARQFLAHPSARGIVAVTCASRLEMLGTAAPDGAPDGEMRFRNPAHPAAKAPGLAPAVLSSI
jgi:hypothetical protein